MQPPCQRLAAGQELIVRLRRKPSAPTAPGGSNAQMARDETKKRGNYDSGEDYVLEYGELRFTFNEEDFRQRVEQAAVKLSFVQPGLAVEELDDLVNLAVSGEHAVIVTILNDSFLEDLGSTNGSRVNGVAIDEVVLGAGDRIEVGDTVLVVESVGDDD